MSSKTIKKWITINGNHVPVYEDGSLGGVAQKFTSNDGTSHASHAEKASGETVESLAKNLKDNYGLEIDSADKHSMSGSMNDEKITMYDKDGNEYEGTYNKYSDGDREIVDIKKKEETGQEEDSGKSISISDTVDMKPGSKIEIEQFSSIDGKSQGYKEFTLGPDGRWSSKDGEAFNNTSHDLAEHSKSEITGVQGHIRSAEIGQRSTSDLDLSKMSDEQLKETAKNTLASGNAEATFALSQEAARRGWKSLNGPGDGDGIYDISKKTNEPKTSFGQEFQGKADQYREKFLTNKSDEEIANIKANLDKSTAIVGTTEGDHVAYKAIEDEMNRRGLINHAGSDKSIKIGDKEVGVNKTKPTSSELYDKANAEYKKSEARSQKTELARAKETGDYSGIFASTYNKMSLSEVKNIGRQLGLSDFALSGSKSEIIAAILRIKRKK